jgi:transposase
MRIDLEGYGFYIRPGFTDMRKGAVALAYLVQEEMGLEPFGKSVFVFCGRSRRTVKAIVWDRNGWLEVSKRLECGLPFRWPDDGESARKVEAGQLAGVVLNFISHPEREKVSD